jgi:hypothetical protein
VYNVVMCVAAGCPGAFVTKLRDWLVDACIWKSHYKRRVLKIYLHGAADAKLIGIIAIRERIWKAKKYTEKMAGKKVASRVRYCLAESKFFRGSFA